MSKSNIYSKVSLICLFLLFFGMDAMAQFPFCNPCKDSTKQENIFFTCYQDYDPVCGCDGKTYRNDCFALNKYSFRSCGYFNGICGNFDIDLNPNFIEPLEQYLKFKVHSKSAGFLNVNIFNAYGVLQYRGTHPLRKTINADGSIFLDSERIENIYISNFNQGLYLVEMIFQGERKVFKVMKPFSSF